MKRVRTGLVMVSVAAALNVGGVAHAALENLPWSDGGAGASDFQVQTGFYCGETGLGFRDNVDNGFDMASLLGFGGTTVGASAASVDVTTVGTDSIATYTETVGDYTVEISYRFTDDNIARTLVTITNNGATSAIGLPVSLVYDHGDTFAVRSVDGGTWRGSGDWFVMSENVASNVFDNYKAVFHMPDGPGSPESPASVVDCAGPALSLSSVNESIVYSYLVDIPAGESRRIVTLQGMAPTADDVTTKVQNYSPGSQTPGSGILGDLSAEDACTVVNWVFDVCGSGGDQPSYDIDIDISNYTRESDLPDTL